MNKCGFDGTDDAERGTSGSSLADFLRKQGTLDKTEAEARRRIKDFLKLATKPQNHFLGFEKDIRGDGEL